MIEVNSWIIIITYAFNVFSSNVFEGNVKVESQWVDPSLYGFYSSQGTEICLVDFVDTESNKKIKSYILMTWDDYSVPPSNELNPVLDKALLFITPFALVFERFESVELTPSEKNIASLIDEKVRRIFASFECDEIIFARDGYTLEPGLQVMDMNEYPFYVELNVARPGSQNIDAGILKEQFAGKMINVNVFEDFGASQRMWLNGGEPEILQSLTDITNDVMSYLNRVLTDGEEDFAVMRDEISEIYLSAKRDNDNRDVYLNQMSEFWTELLTYNAESASHSDGSEMFPDYQPKMTPDNMLDYMPEITDQYNSLPPADAENLRTLIEKFLELKQLTEKFPGEWIDGNMVLGANRREYRPSKYELLLDEAGSRIEKILATHSEDEIKQMPELSDLQTMVLEYDHYSFVHADVMGSGRFFYVDNIIPKTIRIK